MRKTESLDINKKRKREVELQTNVGVLWDQTSLQTKQIYVLMLESRKRAERLYTRFRH
jgi:hypothetical protein